MLTGSRSGMENEYTGYSTNNAVRLGVYRTLEATGMFKVMVMRVGSPKLRKLKSGGK